MGILIETSPLIGYERGQFNLEEALGRRSGESFVVSVITASELILGAYVANDDHRRLERLAFVNGILRRFPVLPVDERTARVHSEISALLRKTGQMIGAQDMWLAATCLANALTIATGNVDEFRRVPGLIVEEWR